MPLTRPAVSRWTFALVMAAMLLFVSACVSNVGGSAATNGCLIFGPIILSDEAIDTMPIPDLQQVEAHNEKWLEFCR